MHVCEYLMDVIIMCDLRACLSFYMRLTCVFITGNCFTYLPYAFVVYFIIDIFISPPFFSITLPRFFLPCLFPSPPPFQLHLLSRSFYPFLYPPPLNPPTSTSPSPLARPAHLNFQRGRHISPKLGWELTRPPSPGPPWTPGEKRGVPGTLGNGYATQAARLPTLSFLEATERRRFGWGGEGYVSQLG